MVNRLQNNLVPRLLSYPFSGARGSGRVVEDPGNEFAHEMDQSIAEAPVSSPVFAAALLKKPLNASFCTVRVLERNPRARESRETREASAAAREEKRETASTGRANEICVFLATLKYDRLMLIITIIIVVVFVASLTLLVGWAGVPGVFLDGLKKRSLV